MEVDEFDEFMNEIISLYEKDQYDRAIDLVSEKLPKYKKDKEPILKEELAEFIGIYYISKALKNTETVKVECYKKAYEYLLDFVKQINPKSLEKNPELKKKVADCYLHLANIVIRGLNKDDKHYDKEKALKYATTSQQLGNNDAQDFINTFADFDDNQLSIYFGGEEKIEYFKSTIKEWAGWISQGISTIYNKLYDYFYPIEPTAPIREQPEKTKKALPTTTPNDHQVFSDNETFISEEQVKDLQAKDKDKLKEVLQRQVDHIDQEVTKAERENRCYELIDQKTINGKTTYRYREPKSKNTERDTPDYYITYEISDTDKNMTIIYGKYADEGIVYRKPVEDEKKPIGGSMTSNSKEKESSTKGDERNLSTEFKLTHAEKEKRRGAGEKERQ